MFGKQLTVSESRASAHCSLFRAAAAVGPLVPSSDWRVAKVN